MTHLLLKALCLFSTLSISLSYTSVKSNERQPWEFRKYWQENSYKPQFVPGLSMNKNNADTSSSQTEHVAKGEPVVYSSRISARTGKEDDNPLNKPQVDQSISLDSGISKDSSLTAHRDNARKRVLEFLRKYSAVSEKKENEDSIDKPLTEPVNKLNDLNVENKPDVSSNAQCGYKACNPGKPDMLNVHIVPHSHDDVGWLKTVDEYFYGARNNIQHAAVQFILDSVFQELQADPEKRFIYVEMAFFSRWWNQLHENTRTVVKQLVNNGQLEFTLGGWSMNDEASTHYSSIIDQHTLGFQFLQDTFGECGRPRMGWQIDPFGHSREQASLFAQFGFDGQFFARLDYQDKDLRQKTKNMESIWFGSESLGDQATLFTGVLYNHYMSPDGFCFECDDEPIMDDRELEDYNVERRVQDFFKAANDQAQYYGTNHIMMTMGGDFQYENARVNFKNYDKLIKHVNEMQSSGSKVNIFYSTPACYAYALNHYNATYGSKSDDFFPYASRDHTFWTGYFTSRPSFKGYERMANNFLQVCKQLDVTSKLAAEKGSDVKLEVLKRAMGIVQHHDGVSGTEKQHVADDYAKMMSKGMAACQDVVSDALNKLLPKTSSEIRSESLPAVQFCQLLNVTYCPTTEENDQFVTVVYNPLGHSVNHWLRIPVAKSQQYSVLDSSLRPVSNQLVPLSAASKSIPDRVGGSAVAELVFSTNIPPLGYSTYFIRAAKVGENVTESFISTENTLSEDIAASDFTIQNKYLQVTFSGSTGLMKSITMTTIGASVDISQTLMYYQGFAGNNSEGKFQSTGAYIFRPQGNQPLPITTGPVKTVDVEGPEVIEVRQTFSDWATQVYRLYKDSKHLEIEWTVGHIPVSDGIGKEIISLYKSSLDTKKTFYTDANGRECLKRVRDYRSTWNLNQSEPVAGNYYPINSRMYIRDENKDLQLTVLTDRSQGGGSIQDGGMEILIHRRLLHDDSFGVGEALNEPGTDGKGLFARGKHYLYFDKIQSSTVYHRELAQYLYMSPVVGFVPSTMDPQEYSKQFRTQWSALKTSLPENVHLLTLEPWRGKSYLLRLEHYFEKNEDSTLSKPATVDLRDLFVPFAISSVEETTLGGNQPLSSATRLQWNVKNYGRTGKNMSEYVKPIDPITFRVELKPMQIRTFIVSVN